MIKNHSFNTIEVNDASEMELYVAIPEGNGPFPAIILIQEAFGVTAHIRNQVEKFCNEGYAVVSPDIFHRTIKRIEAPYTDFSIVTPHYQAITFENLKADLTACYNFIQNQSNISKEKIGCIGYCLGGRVAYIANSILPLSAAISYYGGGIELLTDKAESLHGTHLFIWGGLDTGITTEKIDTVINAVKNAGKEYINIVFSYAQHAFNNDERPNFNQNASNEAWALTKAFFENRLK
jgi:carboxymethylenebutenolidase